MKRVLIVFLILVMLVTSGCIFPAEHEIGVVYVTQMGPADMREQLDIGTIDGFIAWEPFNADAVLSGNGEYLVQSGDIWANHPCCIFAISDAAMNELDEDTVLALVWAHVKATEFINDPDNHNATIQYGVEFTGKDAETIEEAMEHINFVQYPDEEETKTYYHKLNESGLLKNQPSDLGYSDEDAFFQDFLMSRYYQDVRARLDEDPNWKPATSQAVRIGHLKADLHELAVYVAQGEGYYEAVGLRCDDNLVIKGNYMNGIAAMEAFKLGDVDACYLGGAPATLKRVNDDTKIHIIAGANEEGSAIVVGKSANINSVKDLEGKLIAIPGFGTVQDFILRMAAEGAGLTIKQK